MAVQNKSCKKERVENREWAFTLGHGVQPVGLRLLMLNDMHSWVIYMHASFAVPSIPYG